MDGKVDMTEEEKVDVLDPIAPQSGKPQSRLRWGAGIVILALIIVVVLTDVFGRLFVDNQFNVSDLMLGTLIAAEMLIIGIPLSKGQWPFDGRNGEK